MKKQLMGLAACALILSSCSQNQEFENYEQMNREEVRLAPYVNKTKASVTNLDAMKDANYSGFKVFAVQHAVGGTDYSGSPVFMNQLKESWSTDKWTHTGNYYWPESEALSFFMVAPYYVPSASEAAANPTLDIRQGKNMTLPVTIKDNVADQIDILAASVLNQTKATIGNNGRVDFTFKHILSRIGFKARVADNQNLKFKITGISFTYGANIVKNGVFTFGEDGKGTIVAGKTLHGTTTTSTIGIMDTKGTIISSTTPVQINADDAYLMLMPQTSNGNLMTMTLKYQVAVAGDAYDENNPKTATIEIPAVGYLQGKAYTYNLILSSLSGDDGDLLEVTFGVVDVDPWDEGTQPGDQEVPKPTPPAQN